MRDEGGEEERCEDVGENEMKRASSHMHPAFRKSIQRTESRKTTLTETVIAKWRMRVKIYT